MLNLIICAQSYVLICLVSTNYLRIKGYWALYWDYVASSSASSLKFIHYPPLPLPPPLTRSALVRRSSNAGHQWSNESLTNLVHKPSSVVFMTCTDLNDLYWS